MNKRGRLPLDGIRVIDLTWVGAGPFTTKIFGDFGAEVIKVESATRPDQLRRAEPLAGNDGLEQSGYFANRNPNKKSVTLNLKMPQARETVIRLAAQADVIANSFSTGVMQRMGLSYAEIAARNPKIVYLSMPLAEPEGPYASYLGYGMNIAALVGMIHTAAEPGRYPVGTGTNFPDHLPNPLHAAFAVLTALRHVRQSGLGQEIVVPQITSTLSMFPEPVLAYANNRTVTEPAGADRWDAAPRNVYRCAGDDRWCAISVHDDAEFAALCAVIGRPELAADARFADMAARRANAAALDAAIAAWMTKLAPEAVEETLQQAGVPAARVATAADLVTGEPQLTARGFWQYLDHSVMGRTVYHGIPAHFSNLSTRYRTPAPLLGQHNAELPTLAGLSEEELESLRASGALR